MNQNPSIQCSVCGQWKRLHGKDKDGIAIQRFYSCCLSESGHEVEHVKPVCDECCKLKCPYKPMENKTKTIAPLAKIQSVKYVLVDGTEIEWVKAPGTFKVFRKLHGGHVEVLESTDISPTSEAAYYLLNFDGFKKVE